MRWVALVLVLVLSANLGLAITMNCPASVMEDTTFYITVSHTGASDVSLYYGSSWHPFPGASHIYTMSEANPGQKTYWGDAKVDGNWISTGNDLCVVQVTRFVDSPGDISLSISPTSIESGQEISLDVTFADGDGTDEIGIYRGSAMLYVGGTTSCSGSYCTYSTTDTPSSSTTYTAVGYDINRIDYDAAASVSVSGATIPIAALTVSKTNLVVGESATFTV